MPPDETAKVDAVIIDDDPFACELLRHHLARLRGVRVVAEAGTVSTARTVLGRTDYDVAFLDVHLAGGNGFDLVPYVRPDAAIVFVTGRDDQAVRAFEINAADYIVKPVRGDRLEAALARIAGKRLEQPLPAGRYRLTDRIFLRGAAAGGRFVELREIVAVLSSENYSEVVLGDGERWLIRRTMDEWSRILPAAAFARVHRTAMINVGCVELIERGSPKCARLKMRGVRQPIPVSRRLWQELRTRLDHLGSAEE